MNFEDNNQKQIDKLARMEQVYQDKEKHESVMDRIEEAEEEDVCAFPRKIFRTIMFLMWGACIVALLMGVGFTIPLCGALFTLGIFCALSVTKFLKEKKLADAIISALVAAGTIGLSIILLTGNHY